MKLVGVTGKSGSGKTTFSDYLGAKENVGVIHVDEITKEIKSKYFKSFAKNKTKTGNVKLNPKYKKNIYSSPFLCRCFVKVKAKIIEGTLNKKIEELGKENDIVVVDDIFIKYYKAYKKMQTIISIERTDNERQLSLQERDGISKEEALAYDKISHFGKYEINNKKMIEVENNGDKEGLKEIAEQIYFEKLNSEERNIRKEYKYSKPIIVLTRKKEKHKVEQQNETSIEQIGGEEK